MSVKIVKAGGAAMGELQARILGMTLSQMNQLSTLGLQVILIPRNIVTIQAGDSGGAPLTTVFTGTISSAFADLQNQPESAFQVAAYTGLFEAVANVPPTSFPGSVDVATAMAGLASQMQLGFENSGVQVQLANEYLSGSGRDQIQQLAEHAGISWAIDDRSLPPVLAIWPKLGARGGLVPVVSKATGMNGYPAYTAQGLQVKMLYNPNVGLGGKIQVVSELITSALGSGNAIIANNPQLLPASGIWAVYGLTYDLDSITPGGQWFATARCYNPAFAPPVLTQ
jgi:hypothetical protein